MEPSVLVKVIGFIGLAIVCLVSAYASWQTRRLMIVVFGENPRPAQLSQRGYYLRLPEQAPPVVTPPGNSGARALGPTAAPEPALAPALAVEPAAVEPAAVEPAAVEPAAVEPAAVEPAATSAPTASAGPSESFKPPSLAPAELPARPAMRPPPLAREEPGPRVEHAPETTRKPGAAPSSRKRPAVTAPADLAALARELDHADQAQAVPASERPVAIERPPAASPAHALAEPGLLAAGLGERPRETRSEFPPPHKPPHVVRKTTMVGIQPPSGTSPPLVAPVSARPLPAVTPPPVRAFYSSPPPALAAAVTAAARRVSANGGDNAEGAAPLAPPRSFPLATADDFDSDEEATRVMDLPTAEDLAPEKPRARGRATTLVSATAGVPSSARPAPDVQVIGANTPSKPGETTAPVVVP
jgi:hypothetical protein